MTPVYLLDTSTVSEPMKMVPDTALVRKLERHAHESAICAPVWHELQYGCRLLAVGKKRTALEVYLKEVVHASLTVLPYDEVAAAWHGAERARLEGEGTPVPFVDGQIAAIAKCRDLILVTANVKDFRRFEGLRIENWLSGSKK